MSAKKLLYSSVILMSVGLAGCHQLPNLNPSEPTHDKKANRHSTKQLAIKEVQNFVQQKQRLTEKLWTLQTQHTMAINQSDFKQLNTIKKPLFKTQSQLDLLNNKIMTCNKILRHHYHQAVLDNGDVINTWHLLKTNDMWSNHKREHFLINKLRKLQSDQTKINETLWDDQNQITIAINHNNAKQLAKLKTQYFKDRQIALPIANQIDMLLVQVAKFTTSIQQNPGIIKSRSTANDWIFIQTISQNNQRLNQSITPDDPNDDNGSLSASHSNNNDDEISDHPETTPGIDDGESQTNGEGHTDGSDTGGHVGGGETGGHADGGDAGGHAGGDAGGGHGGAK